MSSPDAQKVPVEPVPPTLPAVGVEVTTEKMDTNEKVRKDDATLAGEPLKHDWQFWMIFASMCLIAFASSLDATIITTSLPTIIREIGGASQYVWIGNSFVLASTVIQPLCAQISNVIGRRTPMLVSIALFMLGSGIAGGANGVGMLIAGRTIQGLGGGGIMVLIDLVVCDLLPQRERGKYLGVIYSTAAFATILGPVIGGSLAQANWRWVFWINLPIAGLSLIFMFGFLRLKYRRSPTWVAALARVDFAGQVIFIASMCAILLGLIMGGTEFEWSSWRIILPLVLGFVGWACFHFYEFSPLCKEPSMPSRLFTNRTSLAGYFIAFLGSVLLEWLIYFLPIYFEAVKGTTPLIAGVDVLPLNACFVPFAMLGGGIMSKMGIYRPLHWIGFAFFAIGCGLLSILDDGSPAVEWAWFQIFTAVGVGFVTATVLPAIQASLPESDVGTATGTYAFLRSFGFVWGVTIPSVIFNGQIDNFLPQINDLTVQAALVGGGAYGFASQGKISSLPADTQAEVIGVYVAALKTVWQVAIGFSLIGFIFSFVEKHVELRKELDTEFGIEKKNEKSVDSTLESGESLKPIRGDETDQASK